MIDAVIDALKEDDPEYRIAYDVACREWLQDLQDPTEPAADARGAYALRPDRSARSQEETVVTNDPMIDAALCRLQIRNPPFGIRLSQQNAALLIETNVRDRNTGCRIDVTHPFSVPGWKRSSAAGSDFLSVDEALLWIRDRLADVMLHELLEAFIVDGVRRFEPHL